MKFLSTLETDEQVGDELNEVRKSIESKVNEEIDKIKLNNKEFQDWKWAFIGICINPLLGLDFKEIVRRDNKRKVLEFRLHIDHKAFVDSTTSERYVLFLDALRRSVNHEKMDKWGFLDSDKDKLLEMLNSIESNLT